MYVCICLNLNLNLNYNYYTLIILLINQNISKILNFHYIKSVYLIQFLIIKIFNKKLI